MSLTTSGRGRRSLANEMTHTISSYTNTNTRCIYTGTLWCRTSIRRHMVSSHVVVSCGGLGRELHGNAIIKQMGNTFGHVTRALNGRGGQTGRRRVECCSRALDKDASIENTAVKGLLLSFLASQNRSFFASKCFVEVVQEMYKRGYSLDSLKRMVTFGTLHAGSMEEPMLCDIMLAWLTCVYVTLEEIGLSKYEDGDGDTPTITSSEDGMVAGLRDIARIWITQFNEDGMTLSRLLLQQNMNDIYSEESGSGDFVKMMQQNARLVLLTLQVVRDSGETTVLPLVERNEDVDSENFQISGFIRGMIDMPEDPLDHEHGMSDCRAAAVRLLLSFNGAALGYLVSAKSFVETAAHCYVSGWTADEIYLSLLPEEFEQSGGLVKVARPHGGTNVSATLFARWLSIVYITMAKLGVAHPQASTKQGWAWVSSLGGRDDASDEDSFSGSLEAHGVHDFVCHTLRSDAENESGKADTSEITNNVQDLDAPPADYLSGFSFKFEDPDLIKHSGFALVVMQQISLVTMTRQLVEPRL